MFSIFLAQIPEGATLRILGISGSPHLRRELAQLGIHIGDLVRVHQHVPFGGPILLEHCGTKVALGRTIAERIRVGVVNTESL
ncbi:MAG: FeoA family protein [Terriglobia bacterium]